MPRKRKFIADAISKPGSLRKTLRIKKGKTIPVATLKAAAKRPGITGRRARFALTLRKIRNK